MYLVNLFFFLSSLLLSLGCTGTLEEMEDDTCSIGGNHPENDLSTIGNVPVKSLKTIREELKSTPAWNEALQIFEVQIGTFS